MQTTTSKTYAALNANSDRMTGTVPQILESNKARIVVSCETTEPMAFQHHDEIAVKIGRFYAPVTLGTCEGYARQYNDCPVAAVERATNLGHELHWANVQAVALTAWDQTVDTLLGFEFGDVIELEGCQFTLTRASNSNVALVPVS